MFELSAPPPRALIVSKRAAAAAAWAQTMREVGCAAEPCAVADAPTAAYTADAALLLPDALDLNFIQKMRDAAGVRAFPILCAKDGYEPALEFVDDRLPEQLLANVAAPRLRAAFRAALVEEEINTRADLFGARSSFADFNAPGVTPRRVLVVGRANKAYLAIESALSEAGIATESTPFTNMALDYARSNEVDLIIADGSESSDEALQFCLGLRADAAMNLSPGILLTPPNFDRVSYAMTRGVTEIISIETSPRDIAKRVVRIVDRKRRQDAVRGFFRRQLTTMPCDPETGLFESGVLAKRLQRHVVVAEASGRALSAAILRLHGGAAHEPQAAKAARRLAATLGRILRFEDTAGALDWRTFAILMPAATEANAKAAATRFKTALDAEVLGADRITFSGLDVLGSATQFQPGETGGAFLLRAAAREVFI